MISVLKKLFKPYKILSVKYINTSSRSTQNMNANEGFCTDIVWMDLELTGLNELKSKILEVSCIITDKDLNIKVEGPCFAVHHPESVFQEMNEWCIKTHYKSGLVDKCLKSQISNEQGEQLILDFLKAHVPQGQCPLAGNSIYMDRLFLRQRMPSVDNYLHYRIIDVSTIKELGRRWYPNLLDGIPKKKFSHRSLDDIYDSISELKYYRKTFFNTL